MTRKPTGELRQDELEQQNGEELPDREVMSIVAIEPQPLEIDPDAPPAGGDHTDPGPPQE